MKINKLLILGAFSTFWLIGCSSSPVEDEQTSAEATATAITEANIAKAEVEANAEEIAKQVDKAKITMDKESLASDKETLASDREVLANEIKAFAEERKAFANKQEELAKKEALSKNETLAKEKAKHDHSELAKSEHMHKKATKKKKKPHRSKLIKISGIGYGAASSFANVTKGQRRLMAIRASKLDAYRSLAEQLYGIKIDSNTAVSTLTAKSDSFRARVNALVRGARVVSITPMADSNYETVLEVFVDRSFFKSTFVYSQKRIEEEEANNCDNFDCAVSVGSQY